jgi:hypothetical protein
MSHEFEKARTDVLSHVETLLEEIEHEIALSHQEKFALLEDSFLNASDIDELRVAFDQWYSEHAEDIGFEHTSGEMWDHALGGEHSSFLADDDDVVLDDEEEDDEEEEDDDDEEDSVMDDDM